MHAAMFMQANGSLKDTKRLFLALDGNGLAPIFADWSVTDYFTDKHIQNIHTAIEFDDEG